jgi:hypothetical protein
MKKITLLMILIVLTEGVFATTTHGKRKVRRLTSRTQEILPCRDKLVLPKKIQPALPTIDPSLNKN